MSHDLVATIGALSFHPRWWPLSWQPLLGPLPPIPGDCQIDPVYFDPLQYGINMYQQWSTMYMIWSCMIHKTSRNITKPCINNKIQPKIRTTRRQRCCWAKLVAWTSMTSLRQDLPWNLKGDVTVTCPICPLHEAKKKGRITKPVIAWCVGTCASCFTTEVRNNWFVAR